MRLHLAHTVRHPASSARDKGECFKTLNEHSAQLNPERQNPQQHISRATRNNIFHEDRNGTVVSKVLENVTQNFKIK
jgi:hypothetical protein